MSFPIWCLTVGATAWIIAYLLRDNFVDDSDAKNPWRVMVSVLGYFGIVAGVYGLVLLVVQPA